MTATPSRAALPSDGVAADDPEREFIESLEASEAPFVSMLEPEGRREFEAIARATMNDAREDFAARSVADQRRNAVGLSA